MKKEKVALVCDWLTEKGGAEDVLYELHKMYPEAPIFTSQYRPVDHRFDDADVRTGKLNILPAFLRRYIVPLRQNYFRNLDLSEYDLAISVTGSDAKGIKAKKHLCYCHVPTQYYWGKREEYLKNPGFGILNPLVRVVYKRKLPKLQKRDLEASKSPDEYITISIFAKNEIKQHYKRESKVINPPVDLEVFKGVISYKGTKKGISQIKIAYNKTTKKQTCQTQKYEQKFYTQLKNVENLNVLCKIIAKYPDGFFINFSRQVNWKNLDLAIKCCKNLNLPLVLVGNGPENRRLRKLAKNVENITFVDFLPKTDLAVLCSLAKAFIFPSKEPFGIAPVEALAAGCPVIALNAGGAKDYIKDGKNGIFFKEATEKSLENALAKILTGAVSLDSPEKISKSVEKFDRKNFELKIRKAASSLRVSRKNAEKAQKTSKIPQNESKTLGKTLRRALVLCSPLLLFFSDFPKISLKDISSMHLELTLPLIWLVLFSVLNLKPALNYIKTNLKTPLLAFPLMLLISLVHTSSLLRGVLTFGVVVMILISILGFVDFIKTEELPKNFRKTILTGTTIICVFCIVQTILDSLGVSKDITLLCRGCTSEAFGFPHPNGFAIEPQFLGSLLIAPFFLALNSLLENKTRKSQEKLHQITQFLVALIIGTTLFLSFSRGAIYAVVVAELVLIFILNSWKKFGKIIVLTVFSFVLALSFQMATSKTTPRETVNTVISQLSLGKIKLEETKINGDFDEPEIETINRKTELPAINLEITEGKSDDSPRFNGYVGESTDRRLELATFALKISTESPTNTLFGTGLGSAGTEMFRHFPERQGHEKEIVQNEYLEILLETGLLGIIALILTIVTFVKIEKFKFKPYAFVIVLAFAITLLFFSGVQNSLHLFLLPVLWYNLMYDKDSLSRVQKRNRR